MVPGFPSAPEHRQESGIPRGECRPEMTWTLAHDINIFIRAGYVLLRFPGNFSAKINEN
jgi:hypothetical protein